MITIQKRSNQKYTFENNNIVVNTVFDMGKIWLTKRQVADIYGVKKKEIRRELNNLLINSNSDLSENIQKVYNKEKKKKENIYSLDLLLLLGYKSKHYKETKFLINTNKMIKDYAFSRKYRLNALSGDNIVTNFINNFISFKKVVKV